MYTKDMVPVIHNIKIEVFKAMFMVNISKINRTTLDFILVFYTICLSWPLTRSFCLIKNFFDMQIDFATFEIS